ncbi:hypothetical protein [Paraburkholderia sp. EG304]|uniref:hypothetical protein n=1 Tax=Paraburkholderia sp. EG304 TaxID=3237015 RepID=UPI00397D1898
MGPLLLQDNRPRDRFGPESCRTAYAHDSARADIGAGWILGQQCGGLPTVELSSGRTPATCIAELTLSTINCVWSRHRRLVSVHIEWDDLGAAAWQDIGEIGACTEHTAETSGLL